MSLQENILKYEKKALKSVNKYMKSENPFCQQFLPKSFVKDEMKRVVLRLDLAYNLSTSISDSELDAHFTKVVKTDSLLEKTQLALPGRKDKVFPYRKMHERNVVNFYQALIAGAGDATTYQEACINAFESKKLMQSEFQILAHSESQYLEAMGNTIPIVGNNGIHITSLEAGLRRRNQALDDVFG